MSIHTGYTSLSICQEEVDEDDIIKSRLDLISDTRPMRIPSHILMEKDRYRRRIDDTTASTSEVEDQKVLIKKRMLESGAIRKSLMSYYNNDPPIEGDQNQLAVAR